MLKFYARKDHLEYVPGTGRHIAAEALARPLDPTRPNHQYGEPHEILATRASHDVPDHSPDLDEYRRKAARGGIWCADEATARECGCTYQPLEFTAHASNPDLGVWLPAAPRVATHRTTKAVSE